MTFNSIQYALFLPLVVVVYRALPTRRSQLVWLVGASYAFYAAWDWRFVSLLAVSTIVDYSVGRGLGRTDVERRRRQLVAVSVVVNLSILGFFKYFDFFIGSAQDVLGNLGLEYSELGLRFLLPIGISFYTFQTMSYAIDVYRRRIPPCRDPAVFAAYVAFFPQLVAGPIERAHHLLPQLERRPEPLRAAQVESGLGLILLGLVKKVVIADTVAPVANAAFADPEGVGAVGMAMGVLAFAIQIYADFSAYTDIARGSARLLGIELIHNFHEPYLSRSVTEFWRRWHISLSQWLRDYLYVPLGGNRRGKSRTSVNIMITMLLGGLWHGASWTFVVWGGLNGVYLIADRLYRPERRVTDQLPRTPGQLLATVGTFGLVCFGWVFFRATSLTNAFDALRALVSWDAVAPDSNHVVVLTAAVLATVVIDVVRRGRPSVVTEMRRHPAAAGALVGSALVLIVVFSGSTPVPFIYFQF